LAIKRHRPCTDYIGQLKASAVTARGSGAIFADFELMTGAQLLRNLVVIVLVAANAMTANANPHTFQSLVQLRADVDGDVAQVFAGACKDLPHLPKVESDRLEAAYFPMAASKMKRMNACESLVLGKITKEGVSGRFIRKVVKDIAIKLPTLQRLQRETKKLSNQLSELGNEDASYDRQLARVGYMSPADYSNRATLNIKISKINRELKNDLTIYKTLLGTIWRSTDVNMTKYLSALVKTKLSPEQYTAEALQRNPGWIKGKISGRFSFLESVIIPMINSSRDVVNLINSQYETRGGRSVFYPSFATRKMLTENMDMVDDPDEPTSSFKHLACTLDQKYVSGEDDIDTAVTVATLFVGGTGWLVPALLRAVKLERLVEEGAFVGKVLNAMSKATSAPMMIMTAKGAFETCQAHVDHLNKSMDVCSARSSIEDVTAYESRELDKNNCGLLIFATVASSVISEEKITQLSSRMTGLFSSNPRLVKYVSRASTGALVTLSFKTKVQSVTGTTSTAKDLYEKVYPPKDPSDSDAGSDSK
jgi:hypothetical protein